VSDLSVLLDSGMFDDPYPLYRTLRETQPVFETGMGGWLLTRYDDANRVLRYPDTSVAGGFELMEETFLRVTGEPPPERARSMLGSDPPDHTRLRGLVQQAFTPKVVEELRPLVQGLVDEVLDRVGPTGEMELIGELAFPLPFDVIRAMLGMPEADADQLRDWSHTLTLGLEPNLEDDDLRLALEANAKMDAYLLDVIAWKRANPADDLLTALISAEDDGDMLSDAELLSQVGLLFVAGHETTVNLIGNGVWALLQNRDQLDRLRDDPSLDANAVDELLRYDSPVQFTARTVLSDLELADTTVPAGTMVMGCLGAANRDPEHWGPDAESLDLGREGAGNHLSFGRGIHHCLGSALARLEGRVAIPSLIRRFPTIEATTDDPAWNGRFVLRGLDELPVRWS
jgi:cytochrome P450